MDPELLPGLAAEAPSLGTGVDLALVYIKVDK
jgi:hypothetical protein